MPQPLPPVVQNYVDRLAKREKDGGAIIAEIGPKPQPQSDQIAQLQFLVDGPAIMAELLAHALRDLKIPTNDRVAEKEAARVAALRVDGHSRDDAD